MTTSPRYPEIEVELIGQDGNAFMILGAVRKALRTAKVSPAEIEQFTTEATSDDYPHLLATCGDWISIV